MLQAIYSSKMFLSSKRQSEIRAKIEAAQDSELVQQLICDLDENYQTLNHVAPELVDNSDQIDDKQVDAQPEESIEKSTLHPTPSKSVGQPISFEEPEVDESTDSDSLPDANNEEEIRKDTKEPVTESIHVNILPVDVIKGTLNHNAETAGVSRIESKDKELWIYYNDDVNLNNIMTDVIELLNNTGYTYLSFNRLARSNNAIVFEVANNTDMVGDIIE